MAQKVTCTHCNAVNIIAKALHDIEVSCKYCKKTFLYIPHKNGIFIKLITGKIHHIKFNELRIWKQFTGKYNSSDVDCITIVANNETKTFTDVKGFEICYSCRAFISGGHSEEHFVVIYPNKDSDDKITVDQGENIICAKKMTSRKQLFYLK
jgi:phage FluMu protein Com